MRLWTQIAQQAVETLRELLQKRYLTDAERDALRWALAYLEDELEQAF